jgi:16S rRNA (uracil1498-N3)-methyltransferase
VDDRHHLERVLRLRPGEEVTVADGAGRWRPCRFGPALEPAGEIVVEVPPRPPLTVAFALTKGERPEWTVQKLTEIGVDGIMPFVAERSVVRWDEAKAARQVERLRRVAREAAMQSRRAFLPAVADVAGFPDVASRPDAALAAGDGGPPDLARPCLLVGPEGGWSDAELAFGLPRVSLGPTVLRAETAALAGAVLLAGLRAGLVSGRDLH